ncbi:hypothetical protein TcCL_NonESM11574 [Trypanosoma cruzi]|nr:hypothetical protein TcCL_NonESM11574 [Trypanosoma cruzi]
MPRRKRKARTPRDRRFSVWRGLYSCCWPGHRAPSGGTARRRDATPALSSPGLRSPCGSQGTLSVSVVPLSHTEENGPPLPELLPDVSIATPFRPASGGLTSSRPICGRARSSVHSMRAHARRARPGVPMV